MAGQPAMYERGGTVNKSTLLILTLLFGWLGSHKFYTGNDMAGALYFTVTVLGFVFTAYEPIFWVLYRSTVFWTPSGLKLCGISQDTLLFTSHLGRGLVSMPSNQPGLIILMLKLVQRQAQFFHSIKSFEP
jgi:hypothetical protein